MSKNKNIVKLGTKEADLQYKEFLEKRLNSKNYKANVSEEEYNKTKEKLEKVKLRIKLLY